MTIRWDRHMDMMDQRGFFPLVVGRTPGGVDYPVAVNEDFPPLPPAGNVTVGVVDTGVVLNADGSPHPWFGDHVSYSNQDEDVLGVGRGDATGQGFVADADGHGTFVTGLILREAPRARVTMRGVLDKTDTAGDDTLGAEDDARAAAAVRSLGRDDAVQVINLSFGGGVFTSETVPANLGDALEKLHPRIAVVAAAGNDGSDNPVWPAAFPRVISVGALDGSRLRPAGATPPLAAFSNYGSWVKAYAAGVQVLGPFVDIDETGGDLFGRPRQSFRGWARWSGTSFAAATVSGRIAQTAIELGVTGAAAAHIVLHEARWIGKDAAVWGQRKQLNASWIR
jgi:subtilisin family serine protease